VDFFFFFFKSNLELVLSINLGSDFSLKNVLVIRHQTVVRLLLRLPDFFNFFNFFCFHPIDRRRSGSILSWFLLLGK
jgi:hypothetical protein